jgi:hypothetical protein
MRFLLLSSFVCVMFACKSAYKTLQPISVESGNCVQSFQPHFTRNLYKAQIDVVGNHLSGLLLIKQMPDSSTRLLFTTETGVKFFDFEMAADGNFKVHYIMKKMDKKAVIKTLRKDFELVLMKNLKGQKTFTKDSLLYHRFIAGNDYKYYVTDTNCTELIRIEKASARKLYATIIMKNYVQGVPDTIGITHHNFEFNIGLKLIEKTSIDN